MRLSHFFAFALAFLFFGARSDAAPASQPNVVFILADDLGYGDLGAYGNKTLKTPNIDALATQGMRFTSFYVAAPICTPSRAALLTGRVPERSGLTLILSPRSVSGLGKDEVTLPGLLREAGYRTWCIGKWHLGHLPPFLPTHHGFDTFLGVGYSNDMAPLDLIRGDEVVERHDPVRDYLATLTARYTEEAVKLIEGADAKPFFLYLAHSMPHAPCAASPSFVKSAGGIRGGAIEEIDWSVGEIVAALNKKGLEQNTIIVFTSDNGGLQGYDGPLRGAKSSLFEGGIRVPCLVRWPGHVAAGRVEDRPASMMDWLPTLVGVAGGHLPRRAFDGKDIAAILLGTGQRADEEFSWSNRAYRSGPWKLIRETPVSNKYRLFNVVDDPGEEKDLIGERPEIAKRMQAAMASFYRGVAPPTAPRKR